MKRVVRLNWSSLDGYAEFRPVYSDDSMGHIVQIQIATSDPKFAGKKAEIEKVLVGTEKS